jgi:hypothetical protein
LSNAIGSGKADGSGFDLNATRLGLLHGFGKTKPGKGSEASFPGFAGRKLVKYM